jgi:GNAT superfamily N-acetyltransferase
MRDAAAIAAFCRETFGSSPFPSRSSLKLRRALGRGERFAGIWRGSELVAVAGSEADGPTDSAYLSLLAVLPEYRGLGLTQQLLQLLEELLGGKGIRSFYGTPPATRFGPNLAFARNHYQFGGTITNEASFGGALESVNLWHKALAVADGLNPKSLCG